MNSRKWVQRSYEAVERWRECQAEAVTLFADAYQYLTKDKSSVQDKAISEMLYIQKTQHITSLERGLITAFENRVRIQRFLLDNIIKQRLFKSKDISWQTSIFNALNNAVDYNASDDLALLSECPYDNVQQYLKCIHYRSYILAKENPDIFQDKSPIVLRFHEKAWDSLSTVKVGKDEVMERCVFHMNSEKLQKY